MQSIIFNAMSWKWGGKFQRSRCVGVFIKFKISAKSRKLIGFGISPHSIAVCPMKNSSGPWKRQPHWFADCALSTMTPVLAQRRKKKRSRANQKSGTQGERPFIDWRGARGTLSRVSTTPPHPPPHPPPHRAAPSVSADATRSAVVWPNFNRRYCKFHRSSPNLNPCFLLCVLGPRVLAIYTSGRLLKRKEKMLQDHKT